MWEWFKKIFGRRHPFAPDTRRWDGTYFDDELLEFIISEIERRKRARRKRFWRDVRKDARNALIALLVGLAATWIWSTLHPPSTPTSAGGSSTLGQPPPSYEPPRRNAVGFLTVSR
jgi:hypothetical protein